MLSCGSYFWEHSFQNEVFPFRYQRNGHLSDQGIPASFYSLDNKEHFGCASTHAEFWLFSNLSPQLECKKLQAKE